MIPYTDTHCHLDFAWFQKDREQVIKRAKEAGLLWILNPGIDLETNQAAIELANRYPDFISAAVGIHPNYGKPWTQAILDTLKNQAQAKSVVAIGEIWTITVSTHRSPNSGVCLRNSWRLLQNFLCQ
jgi:TatD DNase family protein